MKGIHARRTPAAAAATGILPALALAAQAQTAIRRDAPMHYVNVENADQFLEPGDIMMKRLGDASLDAARLRGDAAAAAHLVGAGLVKR